MKRTHKTKRVYRVRCQSGGIGWRTRLQNNYASFAEWCSYSDTWGLSNQLGFASNAAAWRANPVLEGSTNSGDFRKVKP